MTATSAADDPSWILDALFIGPHRRYRRLGSLVLGLGGPFLFAAVSCVILGFLAAWGESIPVANSALRVIASLLLFLIASGSYFAVVLTLHLFASCQLPLSVRLLMVYATIGICWMAMTWSTSESFLQAGQVFIFMPLCLGGLLMRWLRGWRAISWGQPLIRRRTTIFSLLDVTTAIAIVLGLISLDNSLTDPPVIWLLMVIGVFAAIGMHVWMRLTSLCPSRNLAGTGFGIWMAVNLLWAFLVFVSFSVNFSSSPAGLLGFVAAPGSLLVAHLWTEIPLRWLRGCGWVFSRVPAKA